VKGTAAERGKQALAHPAHEAREKAERGTGWYALLARTGIVAKGVSFGIVAVLALTVALDAGGKATSRQGALQSLAQLSFGKALLALLAAGFAAYALWRFVEAFAERADAGESEAKGEAKKWGKRAGYVGRGLIYAGLTLTTLRILTGADEKSENEQARDRTAAVFDWPAGRWLVGVAGLAIVGLGLWNVYRGLSRKYEDKWRTGRMSGPERTWGGRVGVVGHVARGVVFCLIGIFISKAAFDYDAQEAIGFDGALQEISRQAYGPWLLGLTAAGLLAYALFCLVDARYRDVSANSSS
jgi:hypothetical protein